MVLLAAVGLDSTKYLVWILILQRALQCAKSLKMQAKNVKEIYPKIEKEMQVQHL